MYSLPHPLAGYTDARSVLVFGNTLYGASSKLDTGTPGKWAGLFAYTAGVLPTVAYTSAQLSAGGVALLPGFNGVGYSPWTFVFESSTSVYIAEDSNPSSYNVIQFVQTGGVWGPPSRGANLSFTVTSAIYSIAGRTEGAEFALYATTPTTLYRMGAQTRNIVVIATAAAGTSFHGVALAPSSPLWSQPTPLVTPSPTSECAEDRECVAAAREMNSSSSGVLLS